MDNQAPVLNVQDMEIEKDQQNCSNFILISIYEGMILNERLNNHQPSIANFKYTKWVKTGSWVTLP